MVCARRVSWFGLGVALVCLGILASACGVRSATPAPTPSEVATIRRGGVIEATAAPSAVSRSAVPTSTDGAPAYPGLLDGVALGPADWLRVKDQIPIAVMIDNNIDAYPQAGLEQADLVYEAFVEGGATRFMAVYWRRDASRIEPVRSARTPFLVWASELGALYAHGGSAVTFNEANAGGQIFEWNIRDLEAFADRVSAAYFRDPNRAAPHDLATSTEALRAAATKLAVSDRLFRPPAELVASWSFKADHEGTSTFPQIGGIEVDWNRDRSPLGVVQWHYDLASNSYRRFQFGGPHLEETTKQQLAATTVIVMRVPNRVVDESGHVVYDQVGTGSVQVFLDGREVDGTWEKKSRTARTRFFVTPLVEIRLNRGPIWIEVVGLETKVQTAIGPDQLPKLPDYRR